MNRPGVSESPVVLIALFGGTGVGKSTFANAASGDNLPIGRDLTSCTRQVMQTRPFELDGKRIVLIDTPGFDDNDVSDVGTLKQIAAFLAESYGLGQRLSGIIYLHRISDNRMGGSSVRTFNLFRRMCGTRSLQNVVIATTMWSRTPTDAERRREEQLRNEFFKPALDERARLVRLEDSSREYAHGIIRRLLNQKELPTQIQVEMHDERLPLPRTEAGQTVEAHIRARVDRQQMEISQIRDDIRAEVNARGRQAVTELEQDELRREAEMQQLRDSIRALQANLEEERQVYRARLIRDQEEWIQGQKRKRGWGARFRKLLGRSTPNQLAMVDPPCVN